MYKNLQEIKEDFAASHWLKRAAEELEKRDINDAIRDLEILLALFNNKFEVSTTGSSDLCKNNLNNFLCISEILQPVGNKICTTYFYMMPSVAAPTKTLRDEFAMAVLAGGEAQNHGEIKT